MSSILDVLRQLEGERAASSPSAAASSSSPTASSPSATASSSSPVRPTDPAKQPRRIGPVSTVVALAVATLVGGFYARRAPAPPPPPATAHEVTASSADTLPEVPARESPPVETSGAANTRPAMNPAAVAPEGKGEAKRTAAVRARTAEATVAPSRAGTSRGGDSGVRLESLTYGPSPSDRSAVVVIGGTRHVFREGDSHRDVAVQLILRDRVYVAQGGNVFALDAPH